MDLLQTNWVKYGIYYGIMSIVIQLISFYVMPINIWLQMLLGIIIMCITFYIAGKAERDDRGGELTYGGALKITFLTGFVGLVIGTLFLIIMIQIVDPGLVEKLTQMSLDAARGTMESFGMPDDQMEKALEKTEEDIANSFTPLRQLLNILSGSIMVLIVAAIMSIFLKKEADPNKIDLNEISGKDV
jgi:Protein of unknown function (DUF4199)